MRRCKRGGAGEVVYKRQRSIVVSIEPSSALWRVKKGKLAIRREIRPTRGDPAPGDQTPPARLGKKVGHSTDLADLAPFPKVRSSVASHRLPRRPPRPTRGGPALRARRACAARGGWIADLALRCAARPRNGTGARASGARCATPAGAGGGPRRRRELHRRARPRLRPFPSLCPCTLKGLPRKRASLGPPAAAARDPPARAAPAGARGAALSRRV